MKFKTDKDTRGKKKTCVYRRLVKDSQHFGNIIKANPKVFGDNAFFFHACGKENMFTSEELRTIAEKMESYLRI